MKLRNGKYTNKEDKREINDICIDFDYASWAWRLNKKYIGYGQFVYISTQL